MKKFLVGGAVRDQLMGVTPKDLDYVIVNSSPEELLLLGFKQVGADFPVFLHPETKDEYALARTERKSGSGYHGFTCYFGSDVTLNEDLSRRDLTINSMALSEDGVLFDPYNGKADIKNKTLRHSTSSFREDPIRLLRIARFSARYSDFHISSETVNLLVDMVKNREIHSLVQERVWAETKKAFLEKKPSRFFDTLRVCGALEILFPEIYNLIGVPQRADYHAEGDCYIHSMMVIDEAANLSSIEKLSDSERVMVVAGALWHDVGKAKTPPELLYDSEGKEVGLHYGHENEDVVFPILRKVRERLKLPNQVYNIICDTAIHHQKVHVIQSMSPKGLNRFFDNSAFSRRGGENHLYLLGICCHADALGRLHTVENEIVNPPEDYPQKNILLKFFKLYDSVSLKSYIEDYKLKNGVLPDKTSIKNAKNQLCVEALKTGFQKNV